MTEFDIRKLDAGDVDAVDRLMKANTATLGFLPREAILAHLQRGRILGARARDGSLAACIEEDGLASAHQFGDAIANNPIPAGGVIHAPDDPLRVAQDDAGAGGGDGDVAAR